MLWMFTLGVIVGRGLSPVRFHGEKIKNELTASKDQSANQQAEREKPGTAMTPETMNFDFYEALMDKKEKARFKSGGKAQEDLAKPLTKQESPLQAPGKSAPDKPADHKPKQKQKPASSVRAGRAPASSFAVQVASLQNSTRANTLVTSLVTKGYEAYSVTVRLPGKGVYHRVRVGHFKDRREASRVLARLRQENGSLEPIIIQE